MAKPGKSQTNDRSQTRYEARRTRNARILFAILCVIIILSMTLSLAAKF